MITTLAFALVQAVAQQSMKMPMARPVPTAHPHVSVAADNVRHEVVFTIGPIDLPSDAKHDAMVESGALQTLMPVTGWLQGYTVDFVDAQGRPVPNKVLHHLNIIEPKRRELFSNIMQRIGAAGEETPPVKTPGMVGYRVEKGDPILLKAMFHNPTGQPYHGVKLVLHMPYVAKGGIL